MRREGTYWVEVGEGRKYYIGQQGNGNQKCNFTHESLFPTSDMLQEARKGGSFNVLNYRLLNPGECQYSSDEEGS